MTVFREKHGVPLSEAISAIRGLNASEIRTESLKLSSLFKSMIPSGFGVNPTVTVKFLRTPEGKNANRILGLSNWLLDYVLHNSSFDAVINQLPENQRAKVIAGFQEASPSLKQVNFEVPEEQITTTEEKQFLHGPTDTFEIKGVQADQPINTSMVLQNVGVFTIDSNNRLRGEILFIANPNYPFTKHPTARNFLEIRAPDGTVIVLKQNTLRFTTSQRDERITFNEGVGDASSVFITSRVWTFQNDALARPFGKAITRRALPVQPPFEPPIQPPTTPPTEPPTTTPKLLGAVDGLVIGALIAGALLPLGGKKK